MDRKIKVTVFNTKNWVFDSFLQMNKEFEFELDFQETRLYSKTASLARGSDAVCVFVNDDVNKEVVEILHDEGVKLIALRCAGFNNVALDKAKELGMEVVRVPAYSPYAVAEHTLGLILSLNRKFHKAHPRVREGNFSLDNLLGFDIHEKVIGVIGAGKIGQTFINMMSGFGCKILIYDKYENQEMKDLGAEYVSLEELYGKSDIISLHCPLTKDTFHMIDENAIDQMKRHVMIINTSRGKLIDTDAVIKGLKSKKIGYLGLDVYEEEEALFFEDLSETIIHDDQFVRLQTFPNVLITAHQAFFTKEAVMNIAETTFENIKNYFIHGRADNTVLF
ncbi:2-hydroxyacid dehydrogenase [Aureivirga sp. CE67]|uniref:2-hydroxyacid dehydrogenase n=1 Tax=Aureivirga sp. CE67 TaxID=1788983 RepID=UPI001E467525|nr:2-hydroxyacid dehydrogenase [Aureivirga sp. CE67]